MPSGVSFYTTLLRTCKGFDFWTALSVNTMDDVSKSMFPVKKRFAPTNPQSVGSLILLS